MIWFIDEPDDHGDRWEVTMFNGVDEEDYYDKVLLLRLKKPLMLSVHDEVLLAIDELVADNEAPD